MRLGAHVLHRAQQLQVGQLALVHHRGLGHGLLAVVAVLAVRLAVRLVLVGRGGAAACGTDRQGHVEVVDLAAQLGGDDAHRAGGLEVVGSQGAVDPLHVAGHRGLDFVGAALDRTGAHGQQVLGRTLHEAQVLQGAALDRVVDVGHRGQDVGQAGQAQRHAVAHAAADVQAGVAADQVPAVVDVVGLGDLDVAPAPAGRLEDELGALVGALAVVLDGDGDAAARLGLGDRPAAAAHRARVGIEGQGRALAFFRTAALQVHVGGVKHHRVPLMEAAEAVDRVEHDRLAPVGFHLLDKRAVGGQQYADHHEQHADNQQGNQHFEQTGHSGFSRPISGRAGLQRAILTS